MSGKNQKGKFFVIGAVVGGLVGATATLLTTPKSGGQLRKDISNQVQTISDKAEQIVDNVGDVTAEWTELMKDAAGAVVEEVRAWKQSREEIVADDHSVSDVNVADGIGAVDEEASSEQELIGSNR